MGFRSANLSHLVRFNSAASSKFLDNVESYIDMDLFNENTEVAHKTFAPSCIRCKRRSWFRLRGVVPDRLKKVDRAFNFTAVLGTACHEYIQKTLSTHLNTHWLDVEFYLNYLNLGYEFTCTKNGYETLVEIKKPYPIRFAVDGLINIDGKIYLLEIKSSEYSSFQNLTDIKPQHIDQIETYCTVLHLHNALVLYIDRQYGEMRCFEKTVTDHRQSIVISNMEEVIKCAESNIAPDKLSPGDMLCIDCPYQKKCKDWG